jgi:phosphonate transport system substrate-binding protein
MRVRHILGILGAAVILSSCGSTKASGDSRTSSARPKVFRYAFTTSSEDPDAGIRRADITQRYLERELGVKVELLRTTAYGAVIEAFRAGKIDGASISPFSYVIATQKVPIEAIVARGSKDGGAGEYRGVLAVPGNSPIKTIDDLIQHSKELTISFVDPASTSGFLMQNAFLQSKGLEPEKDFKKVVFSMSHPASLLTLKAGKVDVAATMERLVKGYVDQGKLAQGDVRILWTSPNIPNQPIAVRKDLPPAFKEDIRRAFIEMREKDPEAWASQSTKSLPMPADGVYAATNDAMFDGLREIARGVKHLSLLER